MGRHITLIIDLITKNLLLILYYNNTIPYNNLIHTCNSLSFSPKLANNKVNNLPFVRAEWIDLSKKSKTKTLQKINPPRSGHVSFTTTSTSTSNIDASSVSS